MNGAREPRQPSGVAASASQHIRSKLRMASIERDLALEASGPGCRSCAPDGRYDDGRNHTPEKTEPGDGLADIVQECRSYHGPSALRAKGNCHLFGDDNRVPPITAAHIKP